MKRLLPFLPLVVAGILFAAPAPKERGFFPIDLQKFGNKELTSNFAGGDETNILKDFPTGEKKFENVTFAIGKKLIMLGSKAQPAEPAKVENIPIGRLAHKLHFLHANGYGGGPNGEGAALYVKDGTPIGMYVIHYDDKSTAEIPLVYGEHSRDWFFVEGEKEPSKAKVVWTGENAFATGVGAKVRVYLMTWDNPKPEKKIVALDYVGRKDETTAAPFCIAISAEMK
jgi:hypothetical protein